MSKQVTVTLSDTQVAEVRELMSHMRDAMSFEEALRKCMDQGITQLSYRYSRNATQWQKAKQEKVLLQELLRERELRKRKELEADDEIVARD